MSDRKLDFREIVTVVDTATLARFPALAGEAVVRGFSQDETNGEWIAAVEAADGDAYSVPESHLATTGRFAPEDDAVESVRVSVDADGRGHVR